MPRHRCRWPVGSRDGKIRRCFADLKSLIAGRRRARRSCPAPGARATSASRPTSSAAPARPASRPTSQAAACTALIDSRRFARQNLAILHSNRGIAYGKAGDYERAIADFDAALRINPNHVRAYLNRGNANFARRDYDRAIADFGHAIRLEPKNAQLVMSRATAYEAKGDFSRAIADYDQALKLDPNLDRRPHQPRALAWRRSGNLDRAIADFDQVIRHNPKDVAAYNNRAIAFADKRDFDRAAADYDQALKLDPKFALDLSQPRPALARQEGLRPRASPISTRRSGSRPTTRRR